MASYDEVTRHKAMEKLVVRTTELAQRRDIGAFDLTVDMMES